MLRARRLFLAGVFRGCGSVRGVYGREREGVGSSVRLSESVPALLLNQGGGGARAKMVFTGGVLFAEGGFVRVLSVEPVEWPARARTVVSG